MKKFILGLFCFAMASLLFAADIDVTVGGVNGYPSISAHRSFVVQQTVDFSVYPLTSTGIVKVLYLPAQTLVSAASLQFKAPSTATNGVNATGTISLGDRTTAADWVGAITSCSNSSGASIGVITANGSNVAPSNAFGQFYSASNWICIFGGTAASTAGVATVSVVLEDLH